MKFSVVIRNKNKEIQIERLLKCLTKVYVDFIDEIIIVDNLSNEATKDVYKKFNSYIKVINIENFTYGSALNKGIGLCSNNWILIMSSHCLPLGSLFFQQINNIIFKSNGEIGGIRLTMAQKFFDYERYLRYAYNDKLSFDLKNNYADSGILANGAVVSKKAWEIVKFDEDVIAFEDKIWSEQILNKEFIIVPCDSIYYYDKRHMNLCNELFSYKTQFGARRVYFKDFSLNPVLKNIKVLFLNNPKSFIKLQILQICKIYYDLKIVFFKNKFKG
jgi:glycosyltransferase involved in cell wall biosynthesis